MNLLGWSKELMDAFQDGQPPVSIKPTYLTLDEIELMVRRACAMGRGCSSDEIARVLEKVAKEVRAWEASDA